MKCSNCGKEIKEGNSFCTNCGTKVALVSNNNNIENIDKEQANIPLNADIPNADNNVDNANVVQNEVNNAKAKKKIPTAIKIIIPIVVILVIILIIVLCNNKNDEEISTDEVIETTEETETSGIETGVKYCYVGEYNYGYLKFNSETAFILKMNYDMEYIEYTGTYTIADDTITLTVTYTSMTEDIETFEPYTETLTILEDGTIEWVTDVETYIFDKNVTIDDNEETTTTSTEDLLEQIYDLYPTLEDTEGIICTDGDNYWLLDEEGNKVYFSDLDSFESALTQCNIDVDNLGTTTEDTSTTNTNSTSTSNNNTSSSTSKSTTNSTSSNSSSQNTTSSSSSKSSSNTTGSTSTSSSKSSSSSSSSSSETNEWTTTVSIGPYQKYTYNGVATGIMYSQWSTTSDCYYYSYLSEPSNVSYSNNTNRGAKYYIDGNYVGEINSTSNLKFTYTFDKSSSITVKVVAPYIYKTDGTYIASNVTLSEKTISVSTLYDSSYYNASSNVLSLANFF